MLILIYRHLSKNAPGYLWLLVLWVVSGRYFALSINVSDSLSGKVYLVQKGVKPALGDFAAFHYAGGGPYAAGVWFLKRVTGIAGATVSSVDLGSGNTDYFVNGKLVGRAKPKAKSGYPLVPGPTGTIPPGLYYMAAPHPDSLDSRYALVGWVVDDQIIGRAIELF
jgi:conjugal transfer pilin signal peptidase TrbI